jgi:hypothetical protein
MVSTSINVESEPFEKGNVRGVVVISAAFFQAVDGNDKATLLTSIDQIDAKGSIPGFVLSMAKAKPLDRVKAIRGIYA